VKFKCKIFGAKFNTVSGFLRANRRAVANIQFSREFVEAKKKMWEADTTKGFLVEKAEVYTKK
jgi:hypothetical protein